MISSTAGIVSRATTVYRIMDGTGYDTSSMYDMRSFVSGRLVCFFFLFPAVHRGAGMMCSDSVAVSGLAISDVTRVGHLQ